MLPSRTTFKRAPTTVLALVALVALAIMALAMIVVQPAQASADHQDGISGRYRGTQDGAGFLMTLQQDGPLLTGAILQPEESDEAAADRVSGALTGHSIFLIRHSDPIQVWIGTVNENTLSGRWFSPAGEGEWHATKLNQETHLAIVKRVAPDQIPAGVITDPLNYEIIVGNRGDVTARDVHVRDTSFPDFFQITGIRVHKGDQVVTPEPGDRIADSDGLAIGNLDAGAEATIIISGVAAPQRTGRFENTAVAAAANADRVPASAVLVVGAGLRAENVFLPPVIQKGHDNRVTYQIEIKGATGGSEIIVADATIFGILAGTSVDVRGARAEGSLDSGLLLVVDDVPQPHVRISVTGLPGHLPAGRYPSTASIGAPTDAQRISVTAELVVRASRPCGNGDHEDDERPDRGERPEFGLRTSDEDGERDNRNDQSDRGRCTRDLDSDDDEDSDDDGRRGRGRNRDRDDDSRGRDRDRDRGRDHDGRDLRPQPPVDIDLLGPDDLTT